MILSSLTAENFRNLEPEEHAFHPSSNIIVGQNGQGKTNLLEAIYFLGTTKSFRTTRAASLFRFGAPTLAVAGRVLRDGVERTMRVALETGEVKRRLLMINGERMPLTEYVKAFTVFAYSADRLDVVRGTPDDRRRFLDRGIASINAAYLDDLSRYQRVLRQRNALLYEIGTGGAGVRSLDAWDEAFTSAAQSVQKAREAYRNELAEAFEQIVSAHRYHVAGVRFEYRPNVADLRVLRKEEVRARISLAGPQRDHLDFTIDGRPAADVLSGGELKTIVLFLKFAKLELFRRRFDEAPLFVLDDIDAELDLGILQKLLAGLPSSTQVFATSAKEAFLEALRAGPHRRLTVENGRVTASTEFG